jgi:hypothetical protein
MHWRQLAYTMVFVLGTFVITGAPIAEKQSEEVVDSVKNEKVSTTEKKAENKSDKSDKKEKESDKSEKDKKDDKDEKNKDKEKKEPKKLPIFYAAEDSEFRFSTRFRPEFFYGKNLRFLNNGNKVDQVLFFRHVLDCNYEYHFGKASRKYDVVIFKMTLRNKGVWGDHDSIASTTESETRRPHGFGGAHKHALPRHFIWIRELWMQMALRDLLCINFKNMHTLTLGAFPFEVGRGISLGSAFGVTPDLLGYYAEAAIDQYAFGAKFSGEFCKDRLTYDLYAGILDNKASGFEHTNAPIRRQQFGFFRNPARGFGIINYVLAGRMRWFLPVCALNKAYIEPYIVFNDHKEHKIEFIGDAQSKLGTAGFAGEFEAGRFEFGFDTAFNFGGQIVHGWDRNVIIEQNRNGYEVFVNSRVKQIDPVTGKSSLALATDANEAIINDSIPKDACVRDAEKNNGQVIGSNSLGVLVNDKHRFTDRETISFHGSMFVMDVAYAICKPELKLCWTFGFASGDENPHKDLNQEGIRIQDFKYNGFISLLEAYTGVRVKSAFLLNGAGKVPRFLSFPSEDVVDPFPSSVARFTNLVFTGTGLQIKLPKTYRKWSINPNLLWYWQESATHIMGKAVNGISSKRTVDKYLGMEANIFAEAEVLPDLRFFAVGSIFMPGKHFRDIKNIPQNKDQKKLFDARLKNEAHKVDIVPVMSDDKAWFLNVGLEYKF